MVSPLIWIGTADEPETDGAELPDFAAADRDDRALTAAAAGGPRSRCGRLGIDARGSADTDAANFATRRDHQHQSAPSPAGSRATAGPKDAPAVAEVLAAVPGRQAGGGIRRGRQLGRLVTTTLSMSPRPSTSIAGLSSSGFETLDDFDLLRPPIPEHDLDVVEQDAVVEGLELDLSERPLVAIDSKRDLVGTAVHDLLIDHIEPAGRLDAGGGGGAGRRSCQQLGPANARTPARTLD